MIENKHFSLDDLNPEPGFFDLMIDGEVKSVRIRPISLGDRQVILRIFGRPEEMQKSVGEMDPEKLTKLVYYLLDKDVKEKFLAQEMDVIDEMGEKKKVKMTGPELLLEHVNSFSGYIKMIQALFKTMGISQPKLDEALKKAMKEQVDTMSDDEKKKVLTTENTST